MSHNEMCENKTDEELVKLTLKSQDFYIHLMQRYEQKLLRYIRRISNFDQDESEDILQETFIKIFENLNDFDKDLKFSSWAYRITHNKVIDHFRKSKRRPDKILWEDNDQLINGIVSEFDLEKEMDDKINREEILSVIKSLNFKYKEVLELRFLEDKSYKEISDILKKPEGTVATLISRAKKQFHKEYEKR